MKHGTPAPWPTPHEARRETSLVELSRISPLIRGPGLWAYGTARQRTT